MARQAAGRFVAPRRIPVFVGAQAECLTCGAEIHDPLTLETLGRYCSPRCLHAQGLPPLFRQGA
jgi:hypothetical protein